jgi:antitoxin (DNA-binding transcriptional repressor) of toxin-antitoxin stability system
VHFAFPRTSQKYDHGVMTMVRSYFLKTIAAGELKAKFLAIMESFDNVATRGYILPVKTVGIRELKNRLSEHLREVRRGEHLLITDRGEVIGELSPPGQSIAETSVPIGLLALARRGVLTLGNPGDRNSYPALPRVRRGKDDAASMLDAERGRR